MILFPNIILGLLLTYRNPIDSSELILTLSILENLTIDSWSIFLEFFWVFFVERTIPSANNDTLISFFLSYVCSF